MAFAFGTCTNELIFEFVSFQNRFRHFDYEREPQPTADVPFYRVSGDVRCCACSSALYVSTVCLARQASTSHPFFG
jgi:hypothetical protein